MRRLSIAPLHLAAGLALTFVAVGALAQDDTNRETQATPCPDATFQPQLMTPPAGRVPRDASIVVGLFPGGTFRDLPPVQLTRRRREVALRREPIAPGLYRLTPDVRRIYGRYDVSGVVGSPEIVFGRPGAPAPPTTPRVSRVERYLRASGGEMTRELRAHFGFPIPNGVVAVLAYWDGDASPDHWVRAVPTRTDAVIWSASGACTPQPEGASPPPASGSIRLAFVDQYGQVSQPSEPSPLPAAD
ncbi:MAG: hypothetical protein RLO52_34395 [Sandaracinaceae bacterium]